MIVEMKGNCSFISFPAIQNIGMPKCISSGPIMDFFDEAVPVMPAKLNIISTGNKQIIGCFLIKYGGTGRLRISRKKGTDDEVDVINIYYQGGVDKFLEMQIYVEEDVGNIYISGSAGQSFCGLVGDVLREK